MTPDPAGGDILTVWADLAEDERRVLLVLARRLLAAQLRDGSLRLAFDARDLGAEAAQHEADAAILRGCASVAAELHRAPPEHDERRLAPPPGLTVAEAAERLGMSESAVRQAYYAGRLRGQKVGGVLEIDAAAVGGYRRGRQGPRRRAPVVAAECPVCDALPVGAEIAS